jgi:hypothetical protein
MADDPNYHSKRAMAELDLALSATCVDAARAHFRLSSLHLEKSQATGEPATPRLAPSP